MRFRMFSGDTLTAVMAAAVTTTAPKVIVRTINQGQGEQNTITALNGTSSVTLFTGTGNAAEFVEAIQLCNNDSAAITVTFSCTLGGTTATVQKITLQANDLLVIDKEGVQIFDSSGQRKQANAATVQTTLGGPINGVIGASTAAAGTTYADAGALPAGTGNIYPTTGADGTKGVILDTSEKVNGRTIFIGNGVSNAILKVYATAGGTINGASANTAFSSASGKGVTIICLSAASNTWLAF